MGCTTSDAVHPLVELLSMLAANQHAHYRGSVPDSTACQTEALDRWRQADFVYPVCTCLPFWGSANAHKWNGCVAQIMSWAAHRTTTRRGPSLFPDGSAGREYADAVWKAFHRLQLEIIRASNDQSIFAWDCNVRTSSTNILASDPSFFEDCGRMELMGHELDSVGDRLGTFSNGI